MVASVRFFLGSDTVDANVTNDSDDEDEKACYDCYFVNILI